MTYSFNMKNTKIFICNALVMSFTSVFLRAVFVRYNVYISSKLLSEGMGVFSLVMTIYNFAVTVATSGLSLATTRIVSEEASLGNDKGVKAAVFKCGVFALCLSMLSFGVIRTFSQFISINIFQGRLSVEFTKLLALCFPCISVSSVFNGYFNAVRKVYKSSLVQIFEDAIKICFTVFLFERFKPSSIESCCTYIICGNICGEFSSMLLSMFLYIKGAYGYKNNKKSKDITSRIIKITVPVALSSYLKSALSSIKQIIIPKCAEKSGLTFKEALSSYGEISGMAVPVVLFPTAISGSVANLIIPEISRCYIKKQNDKIAGIVTGVYTIIVEFSFCVATVLALYGVKLGTNLYGNYNVGIYITLMAPLVIIMYADTLTDSILKGVDGQISVVRINIFDTLLCIALISLIIPKTGAVGYIIVLYISEMVNITLSIAALRKIIKFKISKTKMFLLPTLTSLIVIYLSTFISVGMWQGILLVVCLYYILLYALLKIFA